MNRSSWARLAAAVLFLLVATGLAPAARSQDRPACTFARVSPTTPAAPGAPQRTVQGVLSASLPDGSLLVWLERPGVRFFPVVTVIDVGRLGCSIWFADTDLTAIRLELVPGETVPPRPEMAPEDSGGSLGAALRAIPPGPRDSFAVGVLVCADGQAPCRRPTLSVFLGWPLPRR